MSLRTALLTALFAVLAGCSYALTITVNWASDGRPIFTLARASTAADVKASKNVDLNTFYVFKNVAGAWDYKHPVWSFELSPGSSMAVTNILYGEVPAGFEERVKAVPLAQGAKYQADAFGPGSGGSVEFSIGQ